MHLGRIPNRVTTRFAWKIKFQKKLGLHDDDGQDLIISQQKDKALWLYIK